MFQKSVRIHRQHGGTDILGVHDGLPPGISTADNETGWQMALAKLAALVEAGHNTSGEKGRQRDHARPETPAGKPLAGW